MMLSALDSSRDGWEQSAQFGNWANTPSTYGEGSARHHANDVIEFKRLLTVHHQNKRDGG